ncbi:apoptosis regulatory protein Siva-like isoform X3 [Zootermopsis nevadensis]|uniref:apoptosis regulatory protein Siva-like isoform X3 n=1 Tax=Zootermopsis nevadensis TaxID=136037 RepID=UPI000B8E9349|nr:apoptosis regulatory protein Siva-like isoform X3 [Zootermopsis nevadensis]
MSPCVSDHLWHLYIALLYKTIKMLFVGAKRVVNVAESRVTARQHLDSPGLKHNYKQMFLDSRCQLQSWGTVKPAQKFHCQGCNHPIKEIQSQCTFCEKFLCTHCIVTCAKCNEEFCNACSLVIYTNVEDEHLCLGCCS